MTSHGTREELLQLLALQLKALQDEVFAPLSDAERQEYEHRHDRIRQLYEQLSVTQFPR